MTKTLYKGSALELWCLAEPMAICKPGKVPVQLNSNACFFSKQLRASFSHDQTIYLLNNSYELLLTSVLRPEKCFRE